MPLVHKYIDEVLCSLDICTKFFVKGTLNVIILGQGLGELQLGN
jgi:hypothetical protein